MGLILSVLVVCVGVYKFIQIYSDTDRIVSYEKKALCPTEKVSINSEPKQPIPRVQLCREFLSHEDVEVECEPRILTQDSSVRTSRRFLVTEKDEDISQHSRTPSPRKFLITREHDDNPNLREFVIAKGKPKDNPATERFVLIDTKEDYKDIAPLPLPKQFVITQGSASINQESLQQTFKQGIGIGLNSLRFMGQNISEIENSSTFGTNILASLSGKLETREAQFTSSVLQIYDNTPEEFHRDPSPYPSLDVPIRKGSISSEMLDKAKVSMDEVDEETDTGSTKIDIITRNGGYNTTEYISNQVLVMPPCNFESSNEVNDVSKSEKRRGLEVVEKEVRSQSASRPDISSTQDLRRVNSSSKMYDKDLEEPSSLFIHVLKKSEDEDSRNSLDGIKRGSEARRSFKKKKNRSQNSLGN